MSTTKVFRTELCRRQHPTKDGSEYGWIIRRQDGIISIGDFAGLNEPLLIRSSDAPALIDDVNYMRGGGPEPKGADRSVAILEYLGRRDYRLKSGSIGQDTLEGCEKALRDVFLIASGHDPEHEK